MIRASGAAVAIALIAAAGRDPGAERRFEYAQPHMGTLVRIALYAKSEGVAVRASNAAFDRIARLDETLSDYHDSSELTRLSRLSGTGPVHVSDDLFRVLSAAQEMARASDGAFDPTVGPLSVLWRQARRQGRLPDGERLAAARAHVGYAKMALDEAAHTATLRDRDMQLDLGGIAKGFAADEAAKVLAASGVSRALIAAGGDIVATAPPPGEEGWRVSVGGREGGRAVPPLNLAHAGVSTSGDAEQFVVIEGTRYSHIFEPRSGMALTGRRSVTAVAPNGTTSDALATAVSVMGPGAGLGLVDRTAGAAALFFEHTGNGIREYASARWREATR